MIRRLFVNVHNEDSNFQMSASGSKILGGGFSLESLVMVMEDVDAPHHMLLLRNFMSQGLVHSQPLLYASPSKDPRGFMGTFPSLGSSKDEKSSKRESNQEKGLRIAWQYKKYDENQHNFESHRDDRHEFYNDFDLLKPLDRQFLSGKQIDLIYELYPSRFFSQGSQEAILISQVIPKKWNPIVDTAFITFTFASNMKRKMINILYISKKMRVEKIKCYQVATV
ncbi:hypothetical protein UlMin_016055 [Ulmus minor]